MCFTFEKEDLSPDICHCVKTSLTALVDRRIRAVIKKGKEAKGCHPAREVCVVWTDVVYVVFLSC